MVFGLERKTNGKMTTVPPSEWLWSPEPTHPAIITRELWETAQTVGAEHGTSRDGTGPSSHPAAKRTYALRGRIRHRTCHRRMSGVTREALNQRLRQIEAAENAHAREIEALASETTATTPARSPSAPPSPPAHPGPSPRSSTSATSSPMSSR